MNSYSKVVLSLIKINQEKKRGGEKSKIREMGDVWCHNTLKFNCMANLSLRSSASPYFCVCCPTCQSSLGPISCLDLHWCPWTSAEESECNRMGLHLHTIDVMVSRWSIDFQQDFFFFLMFCLHWMWKGIIFTVRLVVFFSCVLEAGYQKHLPFLHSYSKSRGF